MKKVHPLNIGMALIFLIVGLVILADLIGFLKASDVFGTYWPALLILVGLVTISMPGGSSKMAFSIGLMVLGLLLILRTSGVLASQAGDTVLVILLALSGIAVLVMSVGNQSKPTSKNQEIKD